MNAIRRVVQVVLLGASAGALAAPCGLLAIKPAKIELDGVAQDIIGSRRIDPCAGKLQVRQGEVLVVASGGADRPPGQSVRSPASLDLATVTDRAAGSVSVDRMVAFFTGGRRVDAVQAMRRGSAPRGLPEGKVVLINEPVLAFRAAGAKPSLLVRFVLHPDLDDTRVMARAESAPAVAVNAAMFEEGKRYRWSADLDGTGYSAMFQIVAPEEKARVVRRLGAVDADATLGDWQRTALKAVVFDEHGLAWNRDRLLEDLQRIE